MVSWHPQAARLCLSQSPPRIPDTFTFSQQLRHQIGNLALVSIDAIASWERVLDLQFARRPGDPALWHLYIEIMGKYSNVILTTGENQIVTAAHQVSNQQSSLRPIQTGQPYEKPPILTATMPTLSEPLERWQERLSLIPGGLKRTLLKNYRGLSSSLVTTLIHSAGLEPDQLTTDLAEADWQQLFKQWQIWLTLLETQQFHPGWTETGYTVLGWEMTRPASSVQELIDRYYSDQLNQQAFIQLHHQLTQKLSQLLDKLQTKAATFETRLTQSDDADLQREQADLLMAHSHNWQPGMQSITLPDFSTGAPITIPLNPERNAVQNAQALYKRHQKLKRARAAIDPLLAEVNTELHYLEQIEAALMEIADYQSPDDLSALIEIRDEFIQQGYLPSPAHQTASSIDQEAASEPHRYKTPSGLEILVGRNNRQNDILTFRTASDYDLWFHTQEIPGSHVLLRLNPGDAPETADLELAADLAAYYSRARHSEQVPVIYTEPKHVYKPKGAKPGMTIYKHERVVWGQPQRSLRQSLKKL
jgi:predicted ribosome quality control (RQC) complex YloA/Tae2 family protein